MSITNSDSINAISELAQTCEDFLTGTNRFTDSVPNFRSRPQQTAMTRYVAEAIVNKSTLLIEAGTGVGKTFAYLLPAVLSGKRVVISTHTRYLQEQIYHKDLPNLLAALNQEQEVDVALLKGRSNYLCLEYLDRRWHTPELGASSRSLIEKVVEWSKQTESGDISEFKDLSEEDPLWASLTSTPDNCLGTKCGYYEQCFIAKVRKQAIAADLIVVNHYLLLADMNLKEDGFGQLLPSVDTVIVDEAHQLKDVADNFLGSSFSKRQIYNLIDDIEAEKAVSDTPALRQTVEKLKSNINEIEANLRRFSARSDTRVLLQDSDFAALAQTFQQTVDELEIALSAQKERSEELHNSWQRVQSLQVHFNETLHPDTANVISWYQYQDGYFKFHNSPVEVAPLLREGCSLYNANWIYTSATLSVNEKFDYVCRALGVDEDSECIILDSPFNYREQAVLYFPDELPNPNEPGHTEALLEASYPLLNSIDGKVFFLFTSHRALQKAKKQLQKETQFNLLVQGSMPKRELIRQFYQQTEALLLGTASFWEGVDVRGAGLRCVIVDRLPFASPQDPLVQGRASFARERDGDFFIETTLPEAVVSLRQGIGRLIRDETDNGVIMIGDRRLWTKPYGKVFLNSLPEMNQYHDFASLKKYLRKKKR